MQTHKFLLLLALSRIFSLPSIGQKFNVKLGPNTYRNADNPHYWKNRAPAAAYWQQDVYYNMDMAVDDKEESLSGDQAITYWNNSPDTLNEIYFHLYQNAFQPNSAFHSLRTAGKLYTVFGENEMKGLGTRVQNVTVNGKSVETKYRGDKSVMRIDLPEPLLPNGSVNITTKFATYWDKHDGGNIRRRMKTFTHGKAYGTEVTHFDGVHWYPRICVYDRKFGWTTDPHMGKEFYGDYGAFDVSLTFPIQYIVEATGQLQNKNEV
jgi:aminopeptidase N